MTDHLPWIFKHRPESLDEIQGNNKALERLREWASSFPSDRTPRLLEGPPGVGKSSTAEALASDLNLQFTEWNASSARGQDDVAELASVIESTGEDGRRVVLVDEADSWHHATSLRPLYDALEAPANPVIVTVNDKWETPDGLVKRCNHEEWSLSSRSRKARLKKIRDAEGKEISDALLEDLAERPDLRSAVNDMQVYADRDSIPEDQRQWDESEWDMLDRVLTGSDSLGARDANEALLWLDENISSVYRGLELAWAYEALRRADMALMQDADIARAIVERVGPLRRTEPYRDGEISYQDKSFPTWFKHSAPDATDGSDEAHLYRELTHFESGEPGLSQSYRRFLSVALEHLRDLSTEAKHELILDQRLSPDAYAALDISESEHEDWLEAESPETGEWEAETKDASEW